jgi:hypothetical protein
MPQPQAAEYSSRHLGDWRFTERPRAGLHPLIPASAFASRISQFPEAAPPLKWVTEGGRREDEKAGARKTEDRTQDHSRGRMHGT